MQIILYKNFAEHNMLDKRPYLDKVIELNGTFRDEIDVVNPIIRIEYTTDSYFNIIDFNYVFIGGVEKYYFVDNVTIVRNNEKNESINKCFILDLSLTEDVLTTFLTNINKLVVSISRQEYKYNDDLVDALLPCKTEPLIEIVNSNNAYHFGFTLYTSNFILTTASPSTDAPGNNNDHTSTSPNPNNIYSTSYVFSYITLCDFANKLITGGTSLSDLTTYLFSNPNEALINLIMLPIELTSDKVKKYATREIKLGKGKLDIPDNYFAEYIYDTKYITIYGGSINISRKYNNFLDYSPYTTIEIYIPFYGFFTVDTNIVMNKIIHIYYIVDIVSGAADIQIKDGDNNILYVLNCQLGIVISLTTDNVSEKLRNASLLGIKTMSDIITMGTSSNINSIKAPRKYTPRTGRLTAKYKKYSAIKEAEEMGSFGNFICNNTADVVQALQSHITSGSSSNNITEWNNLIIEGEELRYKLFARIRHVQPIILDDYNYLVGKPAAVIDLIKNFLGYTEVSSCHIEGIGNANNTELSIIENSLKDGIIINKTCVISSVFIVDNNKAYYETCGITVTYNNSTINYKTKFADSGNYVAMYLNVDYANQANLRIFCKNFSKTNIKSITINNGTIEVIDSSIIANTININFKLKGVNSSTNLRIAVE